MQTKISRGSLYIYENLSNVDELDDVHFHQLVGFVEPVWWSLLVLFAMNPTRKH